MFLQMKSASEPVHTSNSRKPHSHPGLCPLPCQLWTVTLRLWLFIHHSKMVSTLPLSQHGAPRFTGNSKFQAPPGPVVTRDNSSCSQQSVGSARFWGGDNCDQERELDKFSVSEAFHRRGQRIPQFKCPSSRAGLDRETEQGGT